MCLNPTNTIGDNNCNVVSQRVYSIFDSAQSSFRYRRPVADRCFLPVSGVSRATRSYADRLSERAGAVPSAKDLRAPVRKRAALSRRVMIVDDHEDNLMLARYIVEEEGHQVMGVLSGEEAVETAIAYQPDLVLLDIVLGEVSGIDIFRQLKQYEQFAHTPVVGITAMTQRDVQREAIAIGFADYLFKPYHIEELCQIVETYCNGIASAHSLSRNASDRLEPSSTSES